VGWISLGLGVAGLGFGTFAGVQTLSKKSDFESQCLGKSCYPGAQSGYDDAKSWATLSTVGLAAGGGLALTGIVLVATAPRGGSSEQARPGAPSAPSVRLGLGSVAFSGAF
jgi:hypothetical protein